MYSWIYFDSKLANYGFFHGFLVLNHTQNSSPSSFSKALHFSMASWSPRQFSRLAVEFERGYLGDDGNAKTLHIGDLIAVVVRAAAGWCRFCWGRLFCTFLYPKWTFVGFYAKNLGTNDFLKLKILRNMMLSILGRQQTLDFATQTHC